MILKRAGCLVLVVFAAACAPKQAPVNPMADALASARSVYESDDDPEFVRLAAPSTLKIVEMLLVSRPQSAAAAADGVQRLHPGTRTAFLHVEAEVRAADAAAAKELQGTRREDVPARARLLPAAASR